MYTKKNKIYELLDEIGGYEISDIHIIEDKPVYVRNAKGDLKLLGDNSISRDDMRGFMHDFLEPDQLDLLVEGHEIDAGYNLGDIRFRVNAYLDKDGIRIAMRKITSKPPTFEEIGLEEDLKKSLMKDRGLILVTGSTGMGKSTTLAAMIDYINKNKKDHIITLEDPVEYIFENEGSLVTQREVGKNTESWGKALKYILRQDPDVIMVGEMRDLETIRSVLTLVETGHLVLSTLHTISAAQTISRIIDVYPPHQQEQVAMQLSLGLELVVSQTLLPDKKGGRLAAREIMKNTKAISNNIKQRKIAQLYSIIETGNRYGMKTLEQALAKLVAKGKIKKDIALSKVRDIQNFNSLIKTYCDDKKVFNPID